MVQRAIEAEIDPDLVAYIVLHESQGSTTILGDMDLTCKRGPNKGKPVRAKGIFQITDCGHPEVSDAEAFNLASSTEIALPLIKDKATCMTQFTTCKAYFKLES